MGRDAWNGCLGYSACEIVWTDAHPPHVEVQRRKMTAEERQLPLEMKDKPEAEVERVCVTCRHVIEKECSAPVGHECEGDGDGNSGWEPIPLAPGETSAAEAM